MDDLDFDTLVHFPGGNLVVAHFEHVALETLGLAVVIARLGKAGEGAAVLFRFGNLFGAHLALALDNYAVGGLLQGEFGDDLGGVSHHGQKFGACNVRVSVFPSEREHDEQQENHHQ